MEPKLRPHAIANFIQITCTLRVKKSHLFMSKVLMGSSCTQSQGKTPRDKNMFSRNSQIRSKFLPICCTLGGGTQTHSPRTSLCSEETEVTEHVWFSWCFLTSTQDFPHTTPFLDHVPTKGDGHYQTFDAFLSGFFPEDGTVLPGLQC